MLERRGTGRGSALIGRSVHNQRIDGVWRDVFTDVLKLFHGLFMSMEDMGILDPISEVDLWCLQFCFADLIKSQVKGVGCCQVNLKEPALSYDIHKASQNS